MSSTNGHRTVRRGAQDSTQGDPVPTPSPGTADCGPPHHLQPGGMPAAFSIQVRTTLILALYKVSAMPAVPLPRTNADTPGIGTRRPGCGKVEM